MKDSTRTGIPARGLLTSRGTRRPRWQQPRGHYHIGITKGPRAAGATRGSSQKVQGLQEPQGAPTATGHQQEISRRSEGQRQGPGTSTNQGPPSHDARASAGHDPGRRNDSANYVSGPRILWKRHGPGPNRHEELRPKYTNIGKSTPYEGSKPVRTG